MQKERTYCEREYKLITDNLIFADEPPEILIACTEQVFECRREYEQYQECSLTVATFCLEQKILKL